MYTKTQPAKGNVLQGSTRITLCVFIDAFGWELARRHPFLDDILTHRAPLQTVFGYSSTCDPTILTGKLPREHGHFTFFTYGPDQSPFTHYRYFQFLPASLMERGRVRAKLSQIMKRMHGITGYFQLYNMPFRYLHLFDYTEKKNFFERDGVNGGQSTFLDYFRDCGIPFSRPEGYDEPAIFHEVTQAVENRSIAFAYLFLGKLDGILHANGTTSEKVSEHIAWYDREIRKLYRVAQERYDEVHLFVFSDHGMTDIRETCDLMTPIERLELDYGTDYVAVYDSTMARFWFLKDGAREAITTALREEPLGHIMSDEELARYGCDFPEHRYGELIFLMDPGVLICPSHMGVKPLAGMHGYTPEHKDSVASFMTNVDLPEMPHRLDGLHDIICADVAPAAAVT